MSKTRRHFSSFDSKKHKGNNSRNNYETKTSQKYNNWFEDYD